MICGHKARYGFDTFSFSYSQSMIPEWEIALYTAKALVSPQGRVLVADFDTYTEGGNSLKDSTIHNWYKQDGVCIEAKTRDIILNKFFERKKLPRPA